MIFKSAPLSFCEGVVKRKWASGVSIRRTDSCDEAVPAGT